MWTCAVSSFFRVHFINSTLVERLQLGDRRGDVFRRWVKDEVQLRTDTPDSYATAGNGPNGPVCDKCGWKLDYQGEAA